MPLFNFGDSDAPTSTGGGMDWPTMLMLGGQLAQGLSGRRGGPDMSPVIQQVIRQRQQQLEAEEIGKLSDGTSGRNRGR